MASKKFHIRDVLSLTTGALLSDSEMKGLYDLVSHVTRVDGFGLSHADKVKVFLHENLPWTKDVSFSGVPSGLSDKDSKQFVTEFIADVAKQYGEYHEIGQWGIAPIKEPSFGAEIRDRLKAQKRPRPRLG